ncbi:hypothetical protein [Streptomyces pseudogriseolus]|uniref:hypothetical protein n=1 Tax=Streptomyces pseudogriseolus TaxID=36817 RepID=UPI000A37CE87
MNAYLRRIIRDMSTRQQETVTAAAADNGDVPADTRRSTLAALYGKRLIHPTSDPRGRHVRYALTALGHGVAEALAELARADRLNGMAPAERATAELTAEDHRDVLRATVRPRAEAPNYAIDVDGANTPAWRTVLSWGHAMASAQKSIRNGARITPGPGGTFTLTSPHGGRRAHFRPA